MNELARTALLGNGSRVMQPIQTTSASICWRIGQHGNRLRRAAWCGCSFDSKLSCMWHPRARRFRMSWVSLSLFAVLLTFATGCAEGGRVATLEKRTAELESTAKTLKASVDRVDRDKSFDQFIREAASVAYLTPGSDGYSVIQMDLGHMTVMLRNVQPYANGTRITLRFGNLTSATINGAKAKLEWGRVDSKGTPDNDNT